VKEPLVVIWLDAAVAVPEDSAGLVSVRVLPSPKSSGTGRSSETLYGKAFLKDLSILR
jgi:hypothetical protein